MPFSLSPSVDTVETDLSLTIKNLPSSKTGVAIRSDWGPALQIVPLESESDLVGKFSTPTKFNYIDWWQAWNFLQYAQSLYGVRPLLKAGDSATYPDGLHNAGIQMKTVAGFSPAGVEPTSESALYNDELAELNLGAITRPASKVAFFHKYVTTKQPYAVLVCSDSTSWSLPVLDSKAYGLVDTTSSIDAGAGTLSFVAGKHNFRVGDTFVNGATTHTISTVSGTSNQTITFTPVIGAGEDIAQSSVVTLNSTNILTGELGSTLKSSGGVIATFSQFFDFTPEFASGEFAVLVLERNSVTGLYDVMDNEKWIVSWDETGRDAFGRNIYVNEVFKNKSKVLYGVNVEGSITPQVDIPQISTITAIADEAGSLDGTYFNISSTTVDYYVWMNLGGTSLNDPAPAGKTAVPIAYTSNDTAATIIGLIETALEGLAFAGAVVGSTYTVTNNTAGAVITPTADVDTGFTIAVSQAGVAADVELVAPSTAKNVIRDVKIQHVSEDPTSVNPLSNLNVTLGPQASILGGTLEPFSGKYVGGTITYTGTYTQVEIMNAEGKFSNPEEFDINLLLAHPQNVNGMPTIADTRKDCFTIVPIYNPADYVGKSASDATAAIIADWTPGGVSSNLTLGSNYYGVFANFKYQYDKYNDVNRWLPLGGDIAGLMAVTDRTRDPWWAAAGLDRGKIKNAIKLAFNPSKANRDDLYVNSLNPIIGVAGEGVAIVWGQKTATQKPSAFDRINVRRLLLTLEKAIAHSAKYVLFEFNDEFTRARIVGMIEPFMRDVKSRRGVYDFLVVCDETNNTAEVIDRNEMAIDVYLKPTRVAEFIRVNMKVTRSDADFNELVGTAA